MLSMGFNGLGGILGHAGGYGGRFGVIYIGDQSKAVARILRVRTPTARPRSETE